jgi:hypothetical protein
MLLQLLLLVLKEDETRIWRTYNEIVACNQKFTECPHADAHNQYAFITVIREFADFQSLIVRIQYVFDPSFPRPLY